MSLDEPVIIETPVIVPEEAPAPPTDDQAEPGQDPSSAPAVTPPPVTTPPTAPVEPTKPVEPEKPVEPVEPVDPGVPTEAPTWTTATIVFDELTVHYRVPITGMAGQRVEVLLDDSTRGGDSILLDNSGFGILDLRPSIWQLVNPSDTTVTFRYVLASGTGPSAVTTLLELGQGRPEESDGEAPVEEDPTETDQTPVEENPISSAPVDDVVITTDAPAEVAPVDEAPAEVAPAEVAPVEVAPVVAAPVEAAPVVAEPVIPAPVEQEPITTKDADVAAPVEAGAVPTEDSPVAE
ncbi:hypothetical protein [Microbacterium sp. BF1]|uniref:hypothetical protein n=1 Tax=Microbacterium sp. BF1 TaxID=2821146 RepID=UPI001C4DDF92|nr:hypothetical protein [Microbacterium sp. BF1]